MKHLFLISNYSKGIVEDEIFKILMNLQNVFKECGYTVNSNESEIDIFSVEPKNIEIYESVSEIVIDEYTDDLYWNYYGKAHDYYNTKYEVDAIIISTSDNKNKYKINTLLQYHIRTPLFHLWNMDYYAIASTLINKNS